VSARRAEAVERIVGEDVDADEILRTAVAVLAQEPDVSWAGIAFLEDGELALGPSAGTPDETRRVSVPIVFRGALVGELAADGEVDVGLLERIATLISTYVLVGWDTAGEAWGP
jgi:putative methionine-R-sulfoxide reductase with GAF domain